MITLENEFLKVEIAKQGAEMQRIFGKEEKIDYLWDGQEEFWNGRAPVLFPIVGRLNHNRFLSNGKEFEMNQHGFARKQEWEVEETSLTQATFILKPTDELKQSYPFDFVLKATYSLNGHSVKVDYAVENNSAEMMPYSLGSHPAFHVPLNGEGTFEDYQLTIEPPMDLEKLEIGTIPYINGEKKPFDKFEEGTMKLKRDLFQESMILDTKSTIETVTLSSNQSKHGVRLYIAEFPYLCLWSKEGTEAPFLCIEPFNGLPDVYGEVGELSEKKGILSLAPSEIKHHTYTIELF